MMVQDGQIALCGARQEVLAKLAELQKQQREEAAKARLLREALERRKAASPENPDELQRGDGEPEHA